MQLELVRMFDDGEPALAVGYATASIVAGFVAVAVATNLVRRSSLR
jgi:fluoride ion exporter CrcB/FEX